MDKQKCFSLSSSYTFYAHYCVINILIYWYWLQYIFNSNTREDRDRGLVGHAKGTYKRGVVWDTFAKQEEECVAFCEGENPKE